MKQILRITIGLTISCLFAALVMGSVFTLTDKAKKHNEHQNVQDTMLELLKRSAARKGRATEVFMIVPRVVPRNEMQRPAGLTSGSIWSSNDLNSKY